MLRWIVPGLSVYGLAPLSAVALQIQAVEANKNDTGRPEGVTQGSVGRWQMACDVGVVAQDEVSFETRYVAIAAIEWEGTQPSSLSNDWSTRGAPTS